MARHYTIGGVRIYRRSLIRLTAEQRLALRERGRVVTEEPVVWPVPDAEPNFEAAQVDPGGTDLWGPGPYLKVPCRALGATDDEWLRGNRIFCPWGYPSERVRVAHRHEYATIEEVELVNKAQSWLWRLTLIPAPRAAPSNREPPQSSR